MKKLLPIIIALLGLVGGLGAGFVLKPPPEPEAHAEGKDGEHGKMTYPALLGVEGSRARAASLIAEATAVLDKLQDDLLHESRYSMTTAGGRPTS